MSNVIRNSSISGFRFTRNVRGKRSYFIWSSLIVTTILISVGLHRQDGRPNVYKQLWASAEAIINYEEYTTSGLDRPIMYKSDEKYVVALYKLEMKFRLMALFMYTEKMREILTHITIPQYTG